MAPEIVVGKAKPSRNTDLYSLAVLLFYMFMLKSSEFNSIKHTSKYASCIFYTFLVP